MAVAGPNPSGTSPDADGARSSSAAAGERTLEEAEMRVAPLLARANLFRMRGQWDEAVAVCTEALRRAPQSATAHSLLGDIYEAQGKLGDALQWYGMAVDLAPDRADDRAKLERVTRAHRAKLREADTARKAAIAEHGKKLGGRLEAPAGAPPGASGGRVAAERTVEWFDRVFPPGRSESIARLIFVACGVLAALILVAAFFVYTTSDRDRDPSLVAHQDALSGGLPPLIAPQPPVVVTVPTPRPQPSPSASPSAVNATPTASPTPAADPISAARPLIEKQLAGYGVTLTDLRASPAPAGPIATIQTDIAITRAAGETATATQERIARTALLAARTVAQALADAQHVAVRVSLRHSAAASTAAQTVAGAALGVPGAAPTPAAAAASDTPVFSGDIPAPAARGFDPALAPTESLLTPFSSANWYPLPSPAATIAASPAVYGAAGGR